MSVLTIWNTASVLGQHKRAMVCQLSVKTAMLTADKGRAALRLRLYTRTRPSLTSSFSSMVLALQHDECHGADHCRNQGRLHGRFCTIKQPPYDQGVSKFALKARRHNGLRVCTVTD